MLIIDFYHLYSGFFSSEAFDKRTDRAGTDVADNTSLVLPRLPFLVREAEKE